MSKEGVNDEMSYNERVNGAAKTQVVLNICLLCILKNSKSMNLL